jgi:hypothetical protein
MYEPSLPPDPSVDPMGFYRQEQQARGLQQQSQQAAGNGPTGYALQLASALAGGQKMSQLRDAANASSLLNGGPGVQSRFGQAGTRIMGLLGG